jgi:trk system potassium uptake protein TrkA
MRIIIAGAGDVGFHIARLLANEKHDITLIDLDEEKLSYASAHLDVAVLKGNSALHSSLEAAGVNRSDLVIAATSSEESNITTAIIAKHLGAQRTVARITNVEYHLKKDKNDLL